MARVMQEAEVSVDPNFLLQRCLTVQGVCGWTDVHLRTLKTMPALRLVGTSLLQHPRKCPCIQPELQNEADSPCGLSSEHQTDCVQHEPTKRSLGARPVLASQGT